MNQTEFRMSEVTLYRREAQCVEQQTLLDVQGAVLALVVQQSNTNLSVQKGQGGLDLGFGKVDIRLPGKENSNSRGARPVYLFR